MTTYTPYPAYRPSGVDWLGDIPSHWDCRRVKSVVSSTINGVWGEDPKDDGNDLVCVRVADFDYDKLGVSPSNLTIRNIPVSAQRSRVLRKGDLLVEKSGGGDIWPVGRVVSYDLGEASVCSNFIARLVPSNEIDNRFLCYTFSTMYFSRLNERSIKQTTGIQNLDLGSYLGERIGFPSFSEQQVIAAFLDRETVWLDTLIAKKRKLVELLHKQRIAVISHAVTKGLNPHAPLKPSGIEWLGDVPAHWEVSKLKYVVHLKSGEGITSENIFAEGEYAVYGGNGLRGYSDKYTHHGNFVLIGRQGALCGNINYGNGKFFASEHAVVATPVRPIATLWLGELLRVMNLNQYSLSAAQPGLAVDRIKQLSVPLPPISEQTTIADHLERQIFHFDDLTKKIETSIALLQKQRTAIISAAVTGKIDVRPQEPA